jgi:DNA replication protein DnaC
MATSSEHTAPDRPRHHRTDSRVARFGPSIPKPLSQLAKLDRLVLDELGYVPASKVGAELLPDVISTAYERSSVIVMPNLPFEEWKEVFGSERPTARRWNG